MMQMWPWTYCTTTQHWLQKEMGMKRLHCISWLGSLLHSFEEIQVVYAELSLNQASYFLYLFGIRCINVSGFCQYVSLCISTFFWFQDISNASIVTNVYPKKVTITLEILTRVWNLTGFFNGHLSICVIL